MPRCRPETVGFTATAPLRATVTRTVDAGPERAFEVLADAASWPSWFPGLGASRWTSPPPFGVGSTRAVRLGALRIAEEFIVWEPGERLGFTFVSASLPSARAGVELVELVPLGSGRTRVSYTVALEPLLTPARLTERAAPVARLAIARGLRGLDRHLARGAADAA